MIGFDSVDLPQGTKGKTGRWVREDGKTLPLTYMELRYGESAHFIVFTTGLPDGRWVAKDADQNIRIQGTRRLGCWDGEVIEYYPDHRKAKVEPFRMGRLHGLLTKWEADGTLAEKASYKGGELDGRYELFDHGALVESSSWKNGRRHGPTKRYGGQGNLLSVTPYDCELREGVQKVYDAKGRIAEKTTYHLGEVNGPVSFYQDGKLVEKGQQRHGRRDGLFTFYEKAKKSYTITFKDGLQHGRAERFFPNGKRATTETFKRDMLEGKRVEWHPSGKKAFEGRYQEGRPEGLHKRWDDKGVLIEELRYKQGLLEGECVFTIDGKKVKKRFSKGKLKK